MPVKVKIWDAEANDKKGGFVEMFSLHASEALANDKARYSKTEPGKEPKETKQERQKVQADETEIPDDWATQDWPTRRKLAVSLGADRRCTSDIANAIIEAEIRRRSGVKQPEPPPGAE